MSPKFHRLLLVLCCGFLVADAAAQEPGGRWYVSALGNYVNSDGDRLVDDGLTGGEFALGIPFRDSWHLEIFTLYNEFNADGFDRDQEQKGLGLGVIRWFDLNNNLFPYVAAAGGYSDTTRINGIDESAPMTSGALGLLVNFGRSRFGWRTEARYRRILEDEALSDVYLSTGLQWHPGRARVTELRGRRGDEDGDGVSDDFDLCPGSAAAADVDARGCAVADDDVDGVSNRLDRCPRTPRGIPVNSRGCPADSDRDGVIDALDNCGNTPWDSNVDERGCPLTRDQDGDGIADDADRCPGTVAGAGVDRTGCMLPERIDLPGVAFELNSSQLLAGSRTALSEAAATLLANPAVNAEVAGHTDDVGDAGYNQWLSQRRAESVKAYLVSQGVDASRLTARGYGEAAPVADNTTAAGRAANRRVELVIRTP